MSQDTQQIKRITWIGLVVNLILSMLKFVVGILGSSQAVIADAVHSLSDMSTDFAVLVGVKFWAAPPDEDHPYGHGRIEALVTAAIGLTLVTVAIGLVYKSISTLRSDHIANPQMIALVGPLVSIILKEILYRWTIIVGTRTKSTAVMANAWHHRSDALSSLPALIAVGLSIMYPELAFIDHVGALVVAIFILKVSWDIISPSLAELIDRGATQKERDKIKKIARNVEGVKGVHAVRTRKFGPNLYVDLHILVEADISVRAGHAISHNVKQKLIDKGPGVIDVVIHFEPND